METNDYRQQPWMRKGTRGRARETTSMCPNCGDEPKFSGAPCSTCGCMEAVIVQIDFARRIHLMILGAQADTAYEQERARRSLLHAELLVNPDRYHRTTAESEYIFSLATTLEVTR